MFEERRRGKTNSAGGAGEGVKSRVFVASLLYSTWGCLSVTHNSLHTHTHSFSTMEKEMKTRSIPDSPWPNICGPKKSRTNQKMTWRLELRFAIMDLTMHLIFIIAQSVFSFLVRVCQFAPSAFSAVSEMLLKQHLLSFLKPTIMLNSTLASRCVLCLWAGIQGELLKHNSSATSQSCGLFQSLYSSTVLVTDHLNLIKTNTQFKSKWYFLFVVIVV